ncbi:MAG: radical SAM family heme chaperone HemW [Proteobacteria bacterium]|nr:radical SAM family heme chaperone HemW [Pseudomonadota bacterium]
MNHEGISIPAIYIHIPFCEKVCPFCSFAVLKDNPARHQHYLELLKQEWLLVSKHLHFDFTCLKSIYVGGGTPSKLNFDELSRLVDWIRQLADVPVDVEWAIELNPEDITDGYAQGLVSLGFQRASLGVQSFNDRHLQSLHRQHRAAQSRKSIETLLKAGIENLNIDLMFGFPGQTIATLEKDLQETIDWNPKHVSVYSLTIEPKTALNRNTAWKNWIDTNETLIASMYRLIVEKLEMAGICQYEVSNFCAKGFESQQNLIYWQSENYLGLGTGAHSHFDADRRGNFKRLVDYKRSVESQKVPREHWEILDPTMKRDEELMLGLRLKSGILLDEFLQKHKTVANEKWNSYVKTLKQNKLLEHSPGHLRLTTAGMLLADEISGSLAATLP